MYIGYFLDGTGWSHAAIDYILSLDAAGVDVVPRAIKLNNNNPNVPTRIMELLKKDTKHPDVVIQNVLPHHIDYNGNIGKNIALYTTETSDFYYSNWTNYINTLDEAWVFNDQSKEASEKSGVNIPIKVVPPGTNMQKFRKSYDKLDLKNENFKFYTIGEINRRKNLPALLTAFHTEFSPEEPVELVIKTTPVNVNLNSLNNAINEVKEKMKLYAELSNYKSEIIIMDYLNENDVMKIHNSCDCYVSTSYGEAWCIPAFDAMGMGKAVICPNHAGFKEYLSEDNAWLIPGRIEPVFGAVDTIPNIFTSRENWFSVDVLELRKSMREAYENSDLRKQKSKNASKRANDFSYEKIGRLMCNHLCHL